MAYVGVSALLHKGQFTGHLNAYIAWLAMRQQLTVKKIRMCIFWHISNNDFCYNLAAFRLSYTPIDVIISLVQSNRSRMQVSSKRPPVYERRVMPHEHTGSSYFVVSSICGIDLHRSA